MAIKTILTDLGNVILWFDFNLLRKNLSDKSMLSEMEFRRKFDPFSDPYASFVRGKTTSRKLYKELCRTLKMKVSFRDFREIWCDVFRPNGNMIYSLRKLRARGYRIVLLSNLDELHYKWVENYFRLDFFDEKIYSFQVKCAKPDEEIFELALPHCKCKKEEVVFIDDLDFNTLAAEDFGYNVIEYTGDFDDLKEELKKLGVKI
ncbi:MAG: HAD family phosphatase [Parcubacteria group bacterium]|nr:HAD family phosphatase [Parcubacteria group bacterium]